MKFIKLIKYVFNYHVYENIILNNMQSNFDEQIQSKHNPVSALDDHVVPDDHGAGVRSDVNQHPQGAGPDGATGNAYTVSAIFRDVIKKYPSL